MKILLLFALALLVSCSSTPAPPPDDPDADVPCNVPTLDDNANCGGCGIVCSAPHASADCDVGVCVVDQCEPGWEDVDRDYANGCEVAARVTCKTFENCKLPWSACAQPLCLAGFCATSISIDGTACEIGDVAGLCADGICT